MNRLMWAFALSVPAAAAHAQTVTVYGLLDAAATFTNAGAGSGTVKQLMSGVGPGSRLGFRGTEDLGGGLSANFTIESGIAVDTGGIQQGGAMWGRQAWVGLSSTPGNWSVSAGRQYAPSLTTFVAADAFGQLFWGNTVGVGYGLYPSPGAAAGSGGHQSSSRINNSLLGVTKFGGLTLRGMIAAGDENSSGTGRFASLGGIYVAGPLTVSATGARFKQYVQSIVADATPEWQDELVVGGSYDFGVVKLFTGYYLFNPSEANRTPAPTTPAGLALDPRFEKLRAYWLGGRVPVGQGTFIAQVMRNDFDNAGPDGRATTLGVAYDYSLSKRTGVYVSYGQVKNNDAGRASLFSTVQAVFAPDAGADPKALSVGIRHSF
jgi:predicted porin